MPKRKSTLSSHHRAPDAISPPEEPDFPRGGVPALTSAEVKEARSQAEADFESEGKARKKQRSSKRDVQRIDETEASFRGAFTGKIPKSAELLRYKCLSVGMKILGIISEVGSKDLVISLPGGLRGFVKAEDSSDLFSEGSGLQCSTAYSSADTGGNQARESTEEEGKLGITLKELFSERQVVACTVTKLDHSKRKEDKKKSKRIGLSLKLGSLHNGLTIDAMHEGLLIRAYVISIEDHGYLLSFGVPEITGFLLHTDQATGENLPRLRKGQLVQGVISSIDRRRGMVMLKADPDLASSSMVKELEGLTLELLIPGTLVNVRVRAVLKNGLLLSFLTYFTGTVDLFHLEDPLPRLNWSECYSENQRLKARILYVDLVTKAVGLTLNTHLVQNKCPIVGVNIGKVYENAVVRRVDPTIGLLVELPLKGGAAAGYVHISNASDQHIEKLQKKFKEGKLVKGRVIGLRLIDGLAVVTLKESKVKQDLLGYEDVKAGMTVLGEVTSVEQFGAFVKLSDGLKALCPLQHMSEFQRVKPSAKFQIGAKMKFKVLDCDPGTKKITITRKKTMLSSKLQPITSYEDAVEGLVTHGWISGVEDYGCFVCFYNNVKGLAHRTELGLDPGVKPESSFQNGQVVKCRVLRADPASRRLSLSFILSPNRFPVSLSAENSNINVVSLGAEVWGLVAHITDKMVVLDVPLAQGFARAFLKIEQLSDSPGHTEQLRSVLHPGHKFERLLVLERDDQKLVVTAKFSLLQSSKHLPSDVSQLHAQEVIQGYIASITDAGCFVRFLGGLTGLASLPQLSDGFVHNPSQHFSIGQSVRAQVVEVNLVSGRFTLSLKQSRCFSTDVSLLQGYFLEEEKIAQLQVKESNGYDLDWSQSFVIGNFVEGEIQDIKPYGVIVNLQDHKDVVGFVTHYQLGGQAEVGKHVTARILDVVKSDGIVDLTLRPELLFVEKSSGQLLKKASLKRKIPHLDVQQKARAIIELIKDEYLVLSLPDHDNAIAFASTHDYNFCVDPHQNYMLGQSVEVTIGALSENSMVGRLLVLLTSFSDPTANPVAKRTRRELANYEAGSIVKGEVVSVEPLEMHVKLGKRVFGRVHITQVIDEYAEGNPLFQYTTGQNISAKVLEKSKQFDEGNKKSFFDLTLRPSELQGVNNKHEELSSLSKLPTLATLCSGQIVTGFVKEVQDECIWLLLSPNLKGRLFVLDSSTDPVELEDFKKRFQIGQAVKCRVLKVDQEKGMLDLSSCGLEFSSGRGVGEQIVNELEIKMGDILGGRVSKVLPGVGGLSVQVGAHLFGRVHITHLHDNWKDNPTEDFQEGQFVRCIVLDVNKGSSGSIQIDLSLRHSLLGSHATQGVTDPPRYPAICAIEKLDDLTVDMNVQGFVKSVTKKGCFVTLSRHVDARILISNLSEDFIDDPASAFPPGKLVKGRIISIEPLSGRVDMSLRRSFIKEATEDLKAQMMKDIRVGDLISGVIRRVEKFGLFILMNTNGLVGLCHISEISDNYIKNLEEIYKVGDKVRAKVLKIDKDKNRVSLGMKEAHLKILRSEDSTVIEKELGFEVENELQLPPDFQSEDPSEILNANDNASQDKEKNMEHTKFTGASRPETSEIEYLVPPLDVVLEKDDMLFAEEDKVETEEISLSVENSEDLSRLSKRAKKRLKNEREAAIRAVEQKRLEGDEAPDSAEDFEKLVHASPSSSFVWIKYMAFMLSLADVDKARSIAERALQTINFREEGEKLNVWVALLNLENVYGNPAKDATLRVFQRALQYCDPKKLYLALLGIYERSEQHDMADELLKTMIRKFRTSSKVWLRRLQNLLKRSMPDAAHSALDRSLLSLPHRKHIKVISQTAIFEFKFGSVERGRNLFEGILRNYPKRTDIWSIYLDQEMGVQDVPVVRALFERATCLDLSPKRMKFLFKKYLDFEKSHGGQEQIDYVKGKAMQYAETRLG